MNHNLHDPFIGLTPYALEIYLGMTLLTEVEEQYFDSIYFEQTAIEMTTTAN